ncbi:MULTISPECIES: HAD family hydrolase [unclassified Candidatus Tisiphia]|uniref:HAD family hydrolase n=1 Tax=unclassified Candidatus Tisiphia TaxID=2996318 RepID=UPI003CCAF4D8
MSKLKNCIYKVFSKKENKANTILVCWDFDCTVVNGHIHSLLKHKNFQPITYENCLIINGSIEEGYTINSTYDPHQIQEIMKPLLRSDKFGLNHRDQLKDTFNYLLNKGYKVAITSHTRYPDTIKPALKKMGLTEKQIEKIDIITGVPTGGIKMGKNLHIEEAMRLNGITDYFNVVLVDDDVRNLNEAQKIGVHAILVGSDIKGNMLSLIKGIKYQKVTDTGEFNNISKAHQSNQIEDNSNILDSEIPKSVQKYLHVSMQPIQVHNYSNVIEELDPQLLGTEEPTASLIPYII